MDPYGHQKRRQRIVEEEMLTHSHDKCYLHFWCVLTMLRKELERLEQKENKILLTENINY